MPAWRGTLSDADLDTLAAYVIDPRTVPAGQALFAQHCATCHGGHRPQGPGPGQRPPDYRHRRRAHDHAGVGQGAHRRAARRAGEYTLAASEGGGAGAGAQLFAQHCSGCHGQFGEGGPNPSRPGDIILPISSADFLKTRDDVTLRAIISQGQPNFGMSPFGTANGGPLADDEIDAIVAFVVSWQANPPVEVPPEAVVATPVPAPLNGAQIYADVCSRCHGLNGEGGIGTALADPEFQAAYDDKTLFAMISKGRIASPMIGWGNILSPDQINQLVQYIRTLGSATAQPTGTPSVAPSFSKQILPLLNDKCSSCHNANTQLGGWDATSYQ